MMRTLPTFLYILDSFSRTPLMSNDTTILALKSRAGFVLSAEENFWRCGGARIAMTQPEETCDGECSNNHTCVQMGPLISFVSRLSMLNIDHANQTYEEG
jgi:hypothetical protein